MSVKFLQKSEMITNSICCTAGSTLRLSTSELSAKAAAQFEKMREITFLFICHSTVCCQQHLQDYSVSNVTEEKRGLEVFIQLSSQGTGFSIFTLSFTHPPLRDRRGSSFFGHIIFISNRSAPFKYVFFWQTHMKGLLNRRKFPVPSIWGSLGTEYSGNRPPHGSESLESFLKKE